MENHNSPNQNTRIDFHTFLENIQNRYELWRDREPVKEAIFNWSEQNRVDLLLGILDYTVKFGDSDKDKFYICTVLTSILTDRKIVYGDNILPVLNYLLELIRSYSNQNYNPYENICLPVMKSILRFHAFEKGPAFDVLEAIALLLPSIHMDFREDVKLKLLLKIQEVIFDLKKPSKDIVKPTYFIGKDSFSPFANSMLDQHNEIQQTQWFRLISLAQKTTGAKPSQKFLKEAESIIAELGLEHFRKNVEAWYAFIIEMKEARNFFDDDANYLRDVMFLDQFNTAAIKAFVWMGALYLDEASIHLFAKLAERCYKKIPDKGPASEGIGNACVYTLSTAKGMKGIAELSRLKLKVKKQTILTTIDKYLIEAANNSGVSIAEIEDMSVSDFNLQNRKRSWDFDDFTCVLELDKIGKSALRWFKKDGAEQKSPPQDVKLNHSEALKKINVIQKQLDQTTAAQKQRLEAMLRENRVFSIDFFQKHYLSHELLSCIITNLIFKFNSDNNTQTAIFLNQHWLDIHGNAVDIEQYTTTTLWHPVTCSTNEVEQWRNFLMAQEIQQPFKQAFREIYLVTDAEIATQWYSNRMASHILRQHQFISTARQRNWSVDFQGSWDGTDPISSVKMPAFNLSVEFLYAPLRVESQLNNSGIWNYLVTEKISFLNAATRERIALTNVPAIAFSEAMRDIDLFIAVASIGNDPTLLEQVQAQQEQHDYWREYSFGALTDIARNRKDILQRLLPKLKIANIAQIAGNYLVVAGKIRTYKIHIGSTNILMEPNNQYLSIVPDKNVKPVTEGIFIPFQDDIVLSTLLSKAFLLAEDHKIKDNAILSQINRQ